MYRFVATCSFSKANREKFNRAGFWMDMASRQWTVSLSASFASLAIAIESLAESGRERRADTYILFANSSNPRKRFSRQNKPRFRKQKLGICTACLHGSPRGWQA